MMDDLFAAALRQAQATAGIADDPARRHEAAARLALRYGEPRRSYHNAGHIAQMLEGLAALTQPMRSASALLLAILYHDAIYDPRRHDNEAQSADLARIELTLLGFPSALVERTVSLIHATEHGRATIAPDDAEAATLLDLDLAILGADTADYQAYARSIRLEYGHVADDAYRLGRAGVLQRFLLLPAIYRTADFRMRLETRAAANIRAEIAALTDQ